MTKKTPAVFEPVAAGKFHRLINHGPCVIVTSGDDESPNAAPIQWNVPINDSPPLVAIALDADNLTSELVKRTGEFVLNIPEAHQIPAVMTLGRWSGRDGSKLRNAGVVMAPGLNVRTPHLRSCLGFIECRVRDAHEYDGVRLVVGEMLYAAADPEKFRDGRYLPVAKTIHHLGGGTFAVTGEIIQAKS